MNDLKRLIREVPDYPKPGILFYDLTTLLKDKQGFHTLIDRLCEHYNGHTIDVVAGIEARGFIFAPALAYRLGAGFVPVRKPKKLPAKTVSVSYSLEYGTDTLEIHEDAVKPGQRVIICDDLLATGGTAAATAKLIQQLGGTVEGGAFDRTAQLLDEFGGRGGRATGGEEVVADDYALAGLDGVFVDFEGVRAVFQGVGDADGFGRKLLRLSNRDKSRAKPVRQSGSKNESAGFDPCHHVDGVTIVMLAEPVD